MKASKQIKAEVLQVMNFAKCGEQLAKRALKVSQGSFAKAVIYARNEVAVLSVPTGSTCFDEFFKKD